MEICNNARLLARGYASHRKVQEFLTESKTTRVKASRYIQILINKYGYLHRFVVIRL